MTALRKTPSAAAADLPEAVAPPPRPAALTEAPPAAGPGLTVLEQHTRLREAYGEAASPPDFGRYSGPVRLLILAAAASGAWAMTLGAGALALRALAR